MIKNCCFTLVVVSIPAVLWPCHGSLLFSLMSLDWVRLPTLAFFGAATGLVFSSPLVSFLLLSFSLLSSSVISSLPFFFYLCLCLCLNLCVCVCVFSPSNEDCEDSQEEKETVYNPLTYLFLDATGSAVTLSSDSSANMNFKHAIPVRT